MNRDFFALIVIVFICLATALVVSEYELYKLRNGAQLTVEIDIRGNEVIATARDGRATVQMRREINPDEILRMYEDSIALWKKKTGKAK